MWMIIGALIAYVGAIMVGAGINDTLPDVWNELWSKNP